MQRTPKIRPVSPEELARLRDDILDPDAGQAARQTMPHSSKSLRPAPARFRRRTYRPREKEPTPVLPPKKKLTPAQETMRYSPPAQSYWAADGFRLLVAQLRELSPSAWKVACYVAYRQLRGLVFSSDPVAISLRELVAGTGLGKTAVVTAVLNAVEAGILKHERHEKGALGTRRSRYSINWTG